MLYSWSIPAKDKADIIEGLSGLGITHRIVFPTSMALPKAYGRQKFCGERASSGFRGAKGF